MMRLSRRAALLWACAVLVCYIALPAEAKFVPMVSYELEGTGAVVTVNGHVAVWFLTPNGNYTPSDRARITAASRIAVVSNPVFFVSFKPRVNNS